MQCEVCGRQIAGKPRRMIIEGAKMLTCEECAKLGSAYWEPETVNLKKPIKNKIKTVVRNIPTRRKISITVPENLEIVEGYGSLLRQAREKMGLSHEDLGRRIREKVSVIKKIEREKMVPDQNLASRLEHALRVKLFVPLVVPKTSFPSPPPSTGVTIGEIVHLKSEKRRHSKERSQS